MGLQVPTFSGNLEVGLAMKTSPERIGCDWSELIMTESTSPEQPKLSDVIERLDRLETALRELIDVVRGTSIRAAPQAAPTAAPVIQVAPPTGRGGLGEPPVIQVAPPGSQISRPAAPPSAQVAQVAAPSPLGVDESLRAHDPLAGRHDLEPPPANATVRQVLTRVFEAGLMKAPEDTFALMTRLTHPSQMQGPRALDHFKAFNWQKLRRGIHAYLINGDPSSYHIAYTDPPELAATDDRIRVFLKVDGRMPVPVGFARDPAQGGAWRVTMMSL